MKPGVRFFTLADSEYFPGVVALVNSLRLQGHDDPITVLDLGFSPDQRNVLRNECEFVTPPPEVARHPWLLEPYACMAAPAETVVYIDADVIVTRPLDALIASARAGKVCVFANLPDDRWFPEWATIFHVSAPRRQTYANAGFLAFSSASFPNLLARWWACCDRVLDEPTIFDGADASSPTAYSSQDALNALLMSDIDSACIEFQPVDAEAQGPEQLAEAEVVDLRSLACRFNGSPTTLLHAWGTPKPWQRDAARTLRRSAYLSCLRRLLVDEDVAVSLPAEESPLWLRPGPAGAAAMWSLTTATRPVRGAWARLRG